MIGCILNNFIFSKAIYKKGKTFTKPEDQSVVMISKWWRMVAVALVLVFVGISLVPLAVSVFYLWLSFTRK